MSAELKNESAALEWLYSTQSLGMKFGLETTRKLLGVMGLPKEGQRFIHVAGTNGKGSVCAMLHSLLKAEGTNAGLFTSPHLVHFRERIRDAEREITSAEVTKGIETLKKISQGWASPPTFFEHTFALAMDWFRKRKRDWVILETGLGGTLDATNIIKPDVCIITNISLDHQDVLGGNLREIARQKAGIIKEGVPVITLKQAPEVMQVLSAVAREKNAPLTIVTTPLRGYQVNLTGQHQLWNATLAVAAFKAAGFKATEPVLRTGLKEVSWPGRFDRYENDRIILDGAHNQASADTLARVWMQTFGQEKAQIVFGCVKDKDMVSLLRALQPIAAGWHFTDFQSPRANTAKAVRDKLVSIYGHHVPSTVHVTTEQALAVARKNPERVLVAGSLYLVGEVLAQLRGEKEWFQSSRQ